MSNVFACNDDSANHASGSMRRVSTRGGVVRAVMAGTLSAAPVLPSVVAPASAWAASRITDGSGDGEIIYITVVSDSAFSTGSSSTAKKSSSSTSSKSTFVKSSSKTIVTHDPDGKNEVVYVKGDASGAQQGIYVVNKFSSGKRETVSDPANYASVENLTISQEFVQMSGSVEVETTSDQPFYYQGDTTASTVLPGQSGIYVLDGIDAPEQNASTDTDTTAHSSSSGQGGSQGVAYADTVTSDDESGSTSDSFWDRLMNLFE